MAGLAGFEPTMTESKSVALPLGYSPKTSSKVNLGKNKMVVGSGFEPPNSERVDLQSTAFSHFATPPYNLFYRLNILLQKKINCKDFYNFSPCHKKHSSVRVLNNYCLGTIIPTKRMFSRIMEK